ncbi:MAG: GGDEF domain-containing protein [Armatimonadota bacterium]
MLLDQQHNSTVTRTVLLLPVGQHLLLEPLRRCCARGNFTIQEAAVDDLLFGSTALVAVICGEWGDERVTALADQLNSAGTVTLLYVTGNQPEPMELREAGIFACFTPQDTDASVLGWLMAAYDAAQNRYALNEQQQNIEGLCAFFSHLTQPGDQKELLEHALDTAFAVIRREKGLPDSRSLAGAILCMGINRRLVLRAARGHYQAFMESRLPDAIYAKAMHVAEHRISMVFDNRLMIPIHRNEQTQGILILESETQPSDISDTLTILVLHLASVLESNSLYELAAIDSTTRAFTRQFVLKRLYESLKSTYRTGQDLTLLMMDLDKFKEVNDSFGHLTGDRVLHEVGVLLHQALRETDILGRYGGDEFIVVLPNTPVAGGMEVAKRIRNNIDEFRLDVDGRQVELDISIGIGGIQQEDRPTGFLPRRQGYAFFQRAMEMLIAQADGLMYRAKRAGTTHIASGHSLSWVSMHGLQDMAEQGTISAELG